MKITIEDCENGYIFTEHPSPRICVYTEFQGVINELAHRFGECHDHEIIKIVKEKE